MRKIICRAALMLALCLPVCALAATEPNAKTIEDTTTYEGDTIKITIDQWCYAFNRTNLRFFVANVYVSDPAQMQTAFAGEQYSKNNAPAPSPSATMRFWPSTATITTTRIKTGWSSATACSTATRLPAATSFW